MKAIGKLVKVICDSCRHEDGCQMDGIACMYEEKKPKRATLLLVTLISLGVVFGITLIVFGVVTSKLSQEAKFFRKGSMLGWRSARYWEAKCKQKSEMYDHVMNFITQNVEWIPPKPNHDGAVGGLLYGPEPELGPLHIHTLDGIMDMPIQRKTNRREEGGK